MISIRFRHFGSAEWTVAQLDGEAEEFAGRALALALGENAELHVQVMLSDLGEFEDLDALEGLL